MAGKVYLIGAGPGDTGLLTCKGREVLAKAEVVVYDALVGSEVLALIPREAERIDAGKRAGNHRLHQWEINQLLLDKALEGKTVVRLKGGDPFLFGRGGEELELLAQHGVPYEIVPGVTSAIAVPAYAGIPVTHRDCCSSVHIITGHRRDGKAGHLPYRALAETGGTLVFLMGVTALPELCAGLLEAGMNPKTPAAIVEKGTTAEQRTVTAPLAELPETAERERVGAPAVIVVGGVCALQPEFFWRERLPLFGCRLVVTRPRARQGTLSKRLRDLGAEVLEVPAIRTEPAEPNEALDRAMDELAVFTWLVFTSPGAVGQFFDRLRNRKQDVRALGGCRLAAIGSGTAAALGQRGLFADLVPEVYDAAHLGETLAAQLRPGDRVLLPRARQGNPVLTELLRQVEGAEITEIPLYDTVYEPAGAIDLAAEFAAHPRTMAVFTSASTVRGFLTAGGPKNITALCIGPQTAAQAKAAGMEVHVAREATLDALIALAKQIHEGEKRP